MKTLLLVLVCAVPVQAQEVRPVPDAISYPMAAVNPALATWKAFHAADPFCELSRLGIAEIIGNGITIVAKHYIRSPRPCAGCAPDGSPSGHSMNSVIGSMSNGWAIGASFSLGTGLLRSPWGANRHTPAQVAEGLLLGAGADLVSHLLKCRS